jgi:hypothetical protein
MDFDTLKAELLNNEDLPYPAIAIIVVITLINYIILLKKLRQNSLHQSSDEQMHSPEQHQEKSSDQKQ